MNCKHCGDEIVKAEGCPAIGCTGWHHPDTEELYGHLPEPLESPAPDPDAGKADEVASTATLGWSEASTNYSEPIVTFHRDGKVELSPRYSTNEAALAIQRAMNEQYVELERQLAAEVAARETAERRITNALALLNPACAEETLEGAIRNLQQAHMTERENAEEGERRLEQATAALARSNDKIASIYQCANNNLDQCSVLPCRVDEMTEREYKIFEIASKFLAAVSFIKDLIEDHPSITRPDLVFPPAAGLKEDE